jgi:N-acetylmuramoyl-L-alanine amidase CwlA
MTYTTNYVQAKAYTVGRPIKPGSSIQTTVTTIIIHWWGDPAGHPTFENTVSYFKNGGNNTSAHYVVEAGRVTQMVSDNDTAYAAGNWAMNLRSINIECNPRATDTDKATVAELVTNLRKTHGNLVMIGHRDVISTDCPGVYYPPNVTLAPWLNNTPPVTPPTPTLSKEEMYIFMQTTEPANPIYLLVPGIKEPRHLSEDEYNFFLRLGITKWTGDMFTRDQVTWVNNMIQPDAETV